jgi:hypothetical protein
VAEKRSRYLQRTVNREPGTANCTDSCAMNSLQVYDPASF